MNAPFPYRVLVAWSEPDESYVARYPALPGCGGDGETEAAAVSAARESADAVLEVMRLHGDRLPQPDAHLASEEYSGQFRLRIPKSLHRELAERAEVEGVSLNHFISTVLASALSGPTDASLTETPMVANTLRALQTFLEQSRGGRSNFASQDPWPAARIARRWVSQFECKPQAPAKPVTIFSRELLDLGVPLPGTGKKGQP